MEGNETESTMEEWPWEEAVSRPGNTSWEETGSAWEASFHQRQEIARRQQECHALHATMPTPDPSLGAYCPRTFDGWSCWNDTPAGTRAFVQCPDFITGFDPHRSGHKDCQENGSWFTHPRTNQSWSNYTTCVDMSNLELHMGVNTLYIAGYSMSLVALCISLFIFCFFKLLVTFWQPSLSASLPRAENRTLCWCPQTECRVLHVFLHYFLVSNYFWMFCEGLYLHTLLVVAFVAEDRIMKWFYLLGWGSPAFFTIIYAACRSTDDSQDVHCWMDDGTYNYILSVPVVLSMLLNLFFLINIVRVLVTKLRAVNTAPDTHSTRKAVRATLILIPLLGLHYILIPFRPPKDSPGEGVYLVVSAVAASFQGLGVSLLFCFFNGEVLGIFKKKWSQHKLMRGGPNSYAATTFSYMKSSMADGNTTITNYGTTIEGDDV
ncbi:calcitonin gene-related peptide type 1 receptor-like [Panulirus ornatus]|uniref:calcitonin gene-related peptide type 1 receptor-like n=1 Tax=Panulirus ornatus TaxID=150431 RepID=UPI003A8ABC7E